MLMTFRVLTLFTGRQDQHAAGKKSHTSNSEKFSIRRSSDVLSASVAEWLQYLLGQQKDLGCVKLLSAALTLCSAAPMCL